MNLEECKNENLISAIGISTLDHLISIDKFRESEGSFYCDSYSADGGGVAATAVCAAAKLGSPARLFSRIGDDINGEFIKKSLQKFEVDLSGLVVLENTSSYTSYIMIEASTGEKQFWSLLNHPVFKKPVTLNIDLLKGTKVLEVDGFWMEAAQTAVMWARQNNVPVVGDFKEMYDGLDKILPYIDYLIVSEDFARKITKEDETHTMLYALKNMISGMPVITQGNKGGTYLYKDEIRNYQTFSVKSIDSTGAGDAFHGAFCHFLANGFSTEDCLDLSSAVGAMNCLEKGGRKGLPDMKVLELFLINNNYKIRK